MPTERLIKKYPNRRLYDTSESAYITLDNVKDMVIQGISFKVVDKKTNEDITRNILLQIIMEQESGPGEPLFNIELLTQVIQNAGAHTQEDFSNFMSKSLHFFTEQQELFAEQFGDQLKYNSSDHWLDIGKKQMDAWQDIQNSFFKDGVASKKNKQP